ncbi:MAG: AAA family ATPase [Tannerellaceae bacterium]|nr:AAA family ATPase [Tannerellaceae bacterium]
MLIEVLKSNIFPAVENIQFISDEKMNNYLEFKTKDGWFKLNEMGFGYQATLSWLVDFMKKLFDRYPDSPNPLQEPAVLLVDEIDLHLHPNWQRSLIKDLSDIFPKTQFIVTTHSPFIIQSMEKVNLYILRKNGDHTEVKHLGNRSYIGWGIEDILSEVMELGDNIYSNLRQFLVAKFENAVNEDNYFKAKEAYDELLKILPENDEIREVLKIQFTQLLPND